MGHSPEDTNVGYKLKIVIIVNRMKIRYTHYPVPGDVEVKKRPRKKVVGQGHGIFIFPCVKALQCTVALTDIESLMGVLCAIRINASDMKGIASPIAMQCKQSESSLIMCQGG